MKALGGPGQEMGKVLEPPLVLEVGLRTRVPHQPTDAVAIADWSKDIQHAPKPGHRGGVGQIRPGQHGLALRGQAFDSETAVDLLGTGQKVDGLVPIIGAAAHP